MKTFSSSRGGNLKTFSCSGRGGGNLNQGELENITPAYMNSDFQLCGISKMMFYSILLFIILVIYFPRVKSACAISI